MIQPGIRELFARDPQSSSIPSFPWPLRDAPAAREDGQRSGGASLSSPAPPGSGSAAGTPEGRRGPDQPCCGTGGFVERPGPGRGKGREEKGRDGRRRCGWGRAPVREGSLRSPCARQVPPACLARGIAAVAVDRGQKSPLETSLFLILVI